MSKFRGRTIEAGGGITTPQQQLAEQTPQAQPTEAPVGGDPLLNQVIAEQAGQAPASAPVDQAVVDQLYDRQAEIAGQQERERVPSIDERRAAAEAGVDVPTRYEPFGGPDRPELNANVDGGLMDRARGMARSVGEGALGLPTIQAEGVSPLADSLRKINALQIGGDGKGFVPTQFAAISSLVTENIVAELSHGEGDIGVTQDQEYFDLSGPTPEQIVFQEGDVQPTDTPFAHEAGNERLGMEIAREWQRYNNKQQGRPTDEYQDISREDANILGSALKNMWVLQNDKLINPVKSEDGRVFYQLTNEGQTALSDSAAARKRLFPKEQVRPSKIKPTRGELFGEGKKITKKASGSLQKREGKRTIEEAMNNLATVPNVVDTQRLRIGLATILPVLGANVQLDPSLVDVFGDIHSVGPGKRAEFAAKAEDPTSKIEDPDAAMQELRTSVAQQVMGTAMERNGANFLTYYMQAFNGRIAPQQTNFDPTAGKFTRFVTRNAVPAMMRPGSRVEKNLRQMYAMMLVKGADVKLPAERERMLDAASAQMEVWGNRLQQVLDASMTDAEAEAIAAAIEAGVPANSQNFPPVKGLQLDPQTDADLIKAIHGKGEDGPHFIDGLIDFAKYNKWRRDQKDPSKPARPFSSYFNAYIDGKTNGIASNGLQMGETSVALATGVIRDSQVDLLDNGDIRDHLKADLLDSIKINGWHGLDSDLSASFNHVAEKVYSIRDLNKKTTMTFGYGQELEKFRDVIAGYMAIEAQSDPELAKHIAFLDEKIGQGEVVEALHKQYVQSLASVLSDDTLEARDLMQAAALVAAFVDKPLTLESYTGFDLVYGDKVREAPTDEDRQRYSLTKDGKREQFHTYDYKTRVTAAAADDTRGVGGRAWGGSIPGPIQSLDAATVALTASGRSWAKLRKASNGNPYLHTIYDAFKMDAMGYDVVLEEVNKNWLDAGLKWSYLEELQKSLKRDVNEWNNNYKSLSDTDKNTKQDVGPGTKYQMVGDLFFKKENSEGKYTQGRLYKMMFKLLPGVKGLSSDDALAVVSESIQRINNKVMPGHKHGPDPGVATELTPAQVQAFIRAFLEETQISSRISSLASKTNKKKDELRKEINKRGPVYQYYAH